MQLSSNLFCQSLSIGIFRPFTLNVIIDRLVPKSDILFFVFCSFSLFLISLCVFLFFVWFFFFFLPSCKLLEHFLEFHFDL